MESEVTTVWSPRGLLVPRQRNNAAGHLQMLTSLCLFLPNLHHARETWTSGQTLWLRDFLPASLPKPGRVMMFEYNSSPAIGASAIKLDDNAKKLLQWLMLKRKASYCPVTVLRY
jgi:hypothetical protein